VISFLLPLTSHKPRPFHPTWFYNLTGIWWAVNLCRSSTCLFFPAFCYFFLRRPKYLLQHPILENSQPVYFFQCGRPNFRRKLGNRKNYNSVSLYLFDRASFIRYILFYFFTNLIHLILHLQSLVICHYMFRTDRSIIRRSNAFIAQAASGTVPSVVDMSCVAVRVRLLDSESNTNGHARQISDRGNCARGCLCN
jgi:hypothetical protein